MRAVIKLSNKEYINIEADYLCKSDTHLMAWKGDDLVAIVKLDLVDTAHLSEKG